MADTAAFLTELARQVKRHPQSYPTWLQILAQDIIETTENLRQRGRYDEEASYLHAAQRFFRTEIDRESGLLR